MEATKLEELEQKIGTTFNDKNLLLSALTHRSYINEKHDWPHDHNERLEFLGDAVLELVVTEFLYGNYPNPEGELTNWRAALVNSVMLAKVSAKFDLNNFVFLSRGEAKDVGRARQFILANAVEAIIGAIYLDQGYEVAKEFTARFILPELTDILKMKSYRDAKSLFQEEAQEKVGITPNYDVLEQWGPDHAKQFRVGVYLNDRQVGEGVGASKQEAQQAAAEDALRKNEWH